MLASPMAPEHRISKESAFRNRLKENTVALYELPIDFWQRVLDPGMHFHLGHFPNLHTSFEESMRLAVERLASRIPGGTATTILDVGCGWGGPAFELSRLWHAEVLGLTISHRQAAFVNSRAGEEGAPVRSEVRDVDGFDFSGIGAFDVLWLYDSFDHMINRQQLFCSLHNATRHGSCLAMATHCLAPGVSRQLYSEFMGIQPIQTVAELTAMLEDAGWQISQIEDCTQLTLPVWRYWIRNLGALSQYPQAKRLATALARTEESYRAGMLRCIQLTARPL